MLTGKQQSIFQPLRKAAWLAFCTRNSIIPANSKAAESEWYRAILVQNMGIFSTKEIKDEKEFDALCLLFATQGNDQEAIAYWSSASERRALWRLRQTMKNAGVNEAYVQGIARNMGYQGMQIEDMPAELILKINTAVFVYMKRKAVKAKAEAEQPAEVEAELCFP